MPPDLEQPPQPRPLPIISEETRRVLLEDLSLDKDFNTVLAEKRNPPGVALPELAESAFDSVVSYNPNLVRTIVESLQKVYAYRSGEVDHYHIDSATEGMGIVLRAYQIESKGELYSRLGDLNEQDLQVVAKVLGESIIPLEQNRMILDRVLGRQRIPEQHAALNAIVNRAADYSIHYPRSTRDGATAMYRVLSSLWGKLSTSDQPPQLPTEPSS